MGRNSGGVRGANGETSNVHVEHYVSGDGMWINDYLRLGSAAIDKYGALSSSEKNYLAGLDKATDRALGKPQTLYRSVDASAVFGKMSDLEYENLTSYLLYGDNSKATVSSAKSVMDRAKKVVHEKGFMSTTKSANVANEWGDFSGSKKPIVIKLSAPAKTRGIDLSKHRMNQGEVLLKRGLKYSVHKVYEHNGHVYVDATILK